MTYYYKVISENSHFKQEYNIDDIFAIPFGTVFYAHPQKTESSLPIKTDFPVLHFSDNAGDAVYWHIVLLGEMGDVPLSNAVIYEITPIGPIIKEKISDHPDNHHSQCGAPAIRIEKQISLKALNDRWGDELLERKRQKLRNTR